MRRSFTLIEVIMVMVIVGILAFGTAPFINAVAKYWQFLQFRNEVGLQARNALDWMVREIREVKDKDSFAVADISQLRFTNSDNVSIDYSLSTTTLLRNSNALADNVSGLVFTYRDRQNNILSPLPLPAEKRKKIWRITLTLSITSGDQSLTLSSDIFPRNLK